MKPLWPPQSLPNIDSLAFEAVAKKVDEQDMYDPLIELLDPFCDGLELCNTLAKEDPQSGAFFDRQVKPGIVGYMSGVMSAGDEDITRARDMVTYMELKIRPSDEPFNDKEGVAFEHDTESSRDT